MTEWQPIATVERKDGTKADLWVPEAAGYPWGRLTNFVWSDTDHGWIGHVDGRKIRIMATEPTHWMAVPSPPKPGGKRPKPASR